jgi:hypothetical protein
MNAFAEELLEAPEPERPDPTPTLPAIENAAALIADEGATIPPEVIEGVLHLGCKLILGSNSKARKTFALIDMAVSVQAGVDFWKWKTRKGRVLYLNFELGRPFMRKRIFQVAQAKGITDLSNLDVWNLRGYAANFGQLLPKLAREIGRGKYILIVLDPVYKGLAGRDENSAGAIGELCNEVERLGIATGAAIAFAAHYAKGNAASKQAIDRISGSGVFTRDADSIMTMTALKSADSFSVELTLRNHPEQQPFAVTWQFPLMTVNSELNPADLKQTAGRRSEFSADQLLDTLGGDSMTTSEWRDMAKNEVGMSERTFYGLLKELQKSDRILQSKIDRKWQALSH